MVGRSCWYNSCTAAILFEGPVFHSFSQSKQLVIFPSDIIIMMMMMIVIITIMSSSSTSITVLLLLLLLFSVTITNIITIYIIIIIIIPFTNLFHNNTMQCNF